MADYKALIQCALEYRKRAYAPYSGFGVGAAVRTREGFVFGGCNIENASYGAANCAERTAVYKAVSEGYRVIDAVAIAGGPLDAQAEDARGALLEECPPCGICRQVLSEFCKPDVPVVLVRSPEDYIVYTLGELLPRSFGPNHLSRESYEDRKN